jgi:hypothetical protein
MAVVGLNRYDLTFITAPVLRATANRAIMDRRDSIPRTTLSPMAMGNDSGMQSRCRCGSRPRTLRAGDNASFRLHLNRLGEIAAGRGDTSRLWREATDLIGRRARLVDMDRKHALAENNVLTRTTASALASALLESVVRNVRDRATLAAIAAEFRQLVDLRGLREE